MDCRKVGSLILALRKEKMLTQKGLAECLLISDKAVSKWERGLGCPDVTLLDDLAKILGVSVACILSGDLNEKQKDVGNMKRMMFYQCKQCKNILTSTSPADITCCGRKISPLIPQGMDNDHRIRLTEMDNEFYAEIDHVMSKEHYISFIAQLTGDKLFLAKLYPEQDAAIRIPIMRNSRIFVHCSEHGLSVK